MLSAGAREHRRRVAAAGGQAGERRARIGLGRLLGPCLAVLAGTLLRMPPLLANRFHPDEALYAYFARLIASGRDPLLAGVVVDKPPLAFYLSALSLAAIGPNELAARLPELGAGIVSVALLYALGRRLYGAKAGHLAAWLLALSPFAILFSITAFVDPLLMAAGLWALWAASAGRWRTLAAALAVGFALKQTVLLFIPLCLALALLVAPLPSSPRAALRRLASAAGPMLPALVLAALLIFSWDAARHPWVSFWSQGYADNIPGRLVRANEVLPRGLAWMNLAHYFTGSTSLNLLFVLCLPLLLLFNRGTPGRAAIADTVLAGYLLLYLAGYWLLAFNVWDRYLLPVLPIWLLLLARVLGLVAFAIQRAAHDLSLIAMRRGQAMVVIDLAEHHADPVEPPRRDAPAGRLAHSSASTFEAYYALGRSSRQTHGTARDAAPPETRAAPPETRHRGVSTTARNQRAALVGLRQTLSLGLAALLLAVAAPAAFIAARSGYPIGGDHGAYDGIDGAARILRALPRGSVLYDHWLSWEWNFYLFDGPVYVAWFASPDSLTTDLKAFGASSPRFLAVPAWESETEVRSAAARAGYDFVLLYAGHRRDGAPTILVYSLASRRSGRAAKATP